MEPLSTGEKKEIALKNINLSKLLKKVGNLC